MIQKQNIFDYITVKDLEIFYDTLLAEHVNTANKQLKMLNSEIRFEVKVRYEIKSIEDTQPDTTDISIRDFFLVNKGFPFPRRAMNCLHAEGIETLSQLLCWCEHQLLRTPNLGKKSLTEIKDSLAHANLKLGLGKAYKTSETYLFTGGMTKCASCLHKEHYSTYSQCTHEWDGVLINGVEGNQSKCKHCGQVCFVAIGFKGF